MKLHLAIVMVAASAWSCSPKAKSSSGSPAAASVPAQEPGAEEGGTDSSTTTTANTNTATGSGSGTNTGTATHVDQGDVALDLNGAVALAIGNDLSNSTKSLYAVTNTGAVRAMDVGLVVDSGAGLNLLDMPAAAGDTPVSRVPDLGCIVPVGANGVLIQARYGSDGFFADGVSQFALVDGDGHINPIVPTVTADFPRLDAGFVADCNTTVQYPGADKVFVLSNSTAGIWQLDLTARTATLALTLATTGGTYYSGFMALANGDVVYEIDHAHTLWHKAAGGTDVDLGYPNVLANDVIPFANGTFTSADEGLNPLSGRFGGMRLSADASSLTRTFVDLHYSYFPNAVPPTVYPYWTTRGVSSTAVRVGGWLVNAVAAVNVASGDIAGNPFYRTAKHRTGWVGSGLIFDGANVVSMTYDGTTGLKVAHEKSIVSDATKSYKVEAVFGPAQGFSGNWRGIAARQGLAATNTTGKYWLEISPATGQVVPGSERDLPAGFENFVAYEIGGNVYGLSVGRGLFALTVDATTATPGASLHSITSVPQFVHATVAADKLYFTTGSGDVQEFDGAAVASITPTGGLTNACGASGQTLLGVIQAFGSTAPGILHCTGAGGLALARFADYTFSGAPTIVSLQTSYALSEFSLSDSSDPLQIFQIGVDTAVLGLNYQGEARVVGLNTNSLLATMDLALVPLENRFELSHLFGDVEISFRGRWDEDTVFAETATSGGANERSYVVNLVSGATHHLTWLDGKMVTSVVRLSATEHLVQTALSTTPFTKTEYVVGNDFAEISHQDVAVSLLQVVDLE